MSVATWLQKFMTNLTAQYQAVSDKGGTVPQTKNNDNLATAIGSIPTGTTPTGTISISQNGQTDVTNYATADVAVPNELIKLLNNELVELVITEPANYYNHNSVFSSQPNLEKVVIKNSNGIIGQQTFFNCTKLKIVDIDGNSYKFNNNVFGYDSAFDTLILRANFLLTIYGRETFNATPFRNGTGGTVYVPYWITVGGSTVQGTTAYANATNWSALESITFASIQENLVALLALGVDITDYYEIVTALPTSDIDTSTVYLIETATAGTYEQWFNSTGSAWVQLANITLGA